MLKSRVFLLLLAIGGLAQPAIARDEALFGWPSAIVFQPYHPWHDGAIAFPSPRGPIPVHVRIYSTPIEPPYYNVPPYIVLDP